MFLYSLLGMSTDQRRRRIERQQLDRISRERLNRAEAEFKRLYWLTEEALYDADPFDRLFRLYNEMEAARMEMREAGVMRSDFHART